MKNGASTIFISSRSEKALDETAKELNELGLGKVISVPADLSKKTECDRLAQEVKKVTPKVDILINNSGATWGEDIFTLLFFIFILFYFYFILFYF